ncbi:hypothetical protein E4P24_16210 [Haloferax sp. AS1]|uniref:hypothetical protein n=1 Tax=Haloferax TaxID=2251 RepID=UPI0019A880F4|nr:hypothetical protein [Haloferax sp. AS1]
MFGALQARIRALLLTLKADRYGGIVVGTRNRSEVVIVYTVKHGDGSADCHAIANFYKQQVRQLGEHLATSEGLTTKNQ